MALTVVASAFPRTRLPKIQHDPKHPTLEGFALTYHDDVYVGRPVGLPRKGVGVARCPPHTLESVVVRTTWLGSDQS